jgi:hypothetical protein
VPQGFESAYAYARACGSLARSYLGERASALAASHRVGAAWRGIFGEPPPALPEAELATAAERGLRSRAYEALRGIAGSLVREEPFFAALVRKREFSYLKSLLSFIIELRTEAPPLDFPDLKPEFDTKGYPDLSAMLRGTRYQWLIDVGLEDLPAVKNRIDRQYYAELWDSVLALPEALAGKIPALVRREAELENIVWALRLARYYGMSAPDINERLIELAGVEVRSRALKALGFRPDSRSDWSAWKWEALVPDSRREEGGEWRFSLRQFETAAHRYLFRLLYRSLHLEMESYTPLYAYFRIKEAEATAMHGIIEGIKLEASAAEIAAFAAQATGGQA